jgi:hypothetical protein
MFVDKIGLPERFDHSRQMRSYAVEVGVAGDHQGQRIRPPRAHLERELRF